MSSHGIQLINGYVQLLTPTGEKQSVLSDINLRIEPGEWVSVVGVNGSGKSTLAQVITGRRELASGSRIARRTRDSAIQLVHQQPDVQIIGATVYEDVCFGLENDAIPSPMLQDRAMNALTRVGLAHKAGQAVRTLSGGEKQRLAMAGCLAVDPGMIVCDEVSAMQDIPSRESMRQLLKDFHKEGKTVVWITQVMEEVVDTPRIVALSNGRIQFDGVPKDFFISSLSAETSTRFATDGTSPCSRCGLRPPYAVQVWHELQRLGWRSDHHPPLTLEELALWIGDVR